MAALPRFIRVVPPPVRLRITLVVVAAMAAIAVVVHLLRGYPLLLCTGLFALFTVGGYEAWCRWPRLRWGIDRARLAEAPIDVGQALRLTFDDGPTPGVTDRVLDLLVQHGVRASFFLLVPKARQNPQLVQRMIRDGHTVGLHGADHRFPFGRSVADLTQSHAAAKAELATIAGAPITLYRPSHGFKNRALLAAVAAAELQLCFWDCGVWDTDAPPPDELEARLRACLPSHGQVGPVVLLHDGLGDDPGTPPHAAPMLAALAAWLPALKA